MNEVARLSWVALTAVNGVGTRTILAIDRYLTKHDIDWGEFWVLSDALTSQMKLTQKLIDRIKSFKKEHTIYSYHEMLKNRDITVLIKGSSEYPPLLARSVNSPVVLFQKGQALSWQDQAVIAVVGTRQMTSYGHLVTTKISRELSQLGAVVVSGFMYGVDVTAHQACLAASGKTVAVLGYGFDHCYPISYQHLMSSMLEKGALFISPFAPHVSPKRGQFVARNRIVAGMSHAVIVTEAAEKSGSHITAGYAADEGKVVCAVPGPITNPYSEGTRWLVNQGAVLVQSGKEVLEECSLGIVLPQIIDTVQDNNPVVEILKSGSFSAEELMKASKLQYTAVISQLSELELSGKVKKEGSRWNLIN